MDALQLDSLKTNALTDVNMWHEHWFQWSVQSVKSLFLLTHIDVSCSALKH